MKKTQLIILLALVALCCSCYSYKIYPKEYRKLENETPMQYAYVVNDTLATAFKILASSGLFHLVSDSNQADLSIRLYPLEQRFVCGQPLTASMLTVGQLPVVLPDRYLFEFDEMEDG